MSADSTDGMEERRRLICFFYDLRCSVSLISNRLLSIGNASLEEKIHVFKELDSPTL